MGAHANPEQSRSAKSVIFELTLLPAAGTSSGSRPKRTFALDRPLRIGADAANHVVINGEGVGAFHGRFIPGLDSPILVLSDSASINGLVAQGSVGLIPGDVIAIGVHQMRVSAHGMAEDSAAGGAAVWQLVSDDGVASVQVADNVMIGSADSGGGICLTDADIASRHIQLVRRNGALWVRDFSDGATFVNEEPVSGARRMAPGDALRIGPHQFRVDRKTRTGIEQSRVTAAVAVVELPSISVEIDLPGKLPSGSELPAVEAARMPAAVWEVDEPADVPTEELPRSIESPLEVAGLPLSRDAKPKPREALGDARPRPTDIAVGTQLKPRKTSADAQPKPVSSAAAKAKPRLSSADARPKPREKSSDPRPKPRVPPPSLARESVRVEERRATAMRVERRTSMRAPARGRSVPRSGRQAPRWRAPMLIVVLTLAWAVAMKPAESRDRLTEILDGRSWAAAFDQAIVAGRSMQRTAVDWLRIQAANKPHEVAEVASSPSAGATVAPDGAVADQPLVTQDILELRRKAAAGEAAARAHLKELRDFYAQLAASAASRGDTAAAQRQLAMVQLLQVSPGEADSAGWMASAKTSQQGPASPVEPPVSPQPVSQPRVEPSVSADGALLVEAQQLIARGAIVSPERRNAISVLLEAMRLEPANEGARRQLNGAIGSLNAQVDTLIANHQFAAARTILELLTRSGMPVLSNGNVRDRPSYLDAPSWRALAVSSLLVEADALIQRGLIAAPGGENAISLLVSAMRIDPANPHVQDMRVNSSRMLLLAAEQADEQGRSDEARRLANLAVYVRDGFGA